MISAGDLFYPLPDGLYTCAGCQTATTTPVRSRDDHASRHDPI